MAQSRNLFLAAILVFGGMAFGATHDGSKIPACKGVTDVCMSASFTGKDGKPSHGYMPGQHKSAREGLWADCVMKLAHGKQVPGITGVTQQQAQACMDGVKAARKAHGKK